MSGSVPMGSAQHVGIRSLERAFGVLELMAEGGGRKGVTQLAAESRLPLTTLYRILRTLVQLGYLRQEPSRKYALGARLIQLGEASSHMLSSWAQPALTRLTEEIGESVNLAIMDGYQVLYVAQVHSDRSMRMVTDVGSRALPHCTAVGKAMLSTMTEDEVRAILARTGMPRHTDNTITDPDTYLDQLRWTSEHGYALEDAEQEAGIRCVAVMVHDRPHRLAVSVSGPTTRMTDAVVARVVSVLTRARRDLSAELR